METMSVGACIGGFRLDRAEPAPEQRGTALLFEHVKSGARLLHIHVPQDTENAFAAIFPTPPPDDTGVPHILEHCVLGGSKRFPVKEPFFEMVKMSMATFINAMTAQAFTVYPVASNVKKDFFNLVEVYLDAVFHPELKEATFAREGHHLALKDNADPASPLTVKGIVYSEMKGAYSSAESVAVDASMRGLFPDTALGRDSGGDPDHIPDLTFDAFRAFYASHYHPSNALVFIYGDIPTEEHLRFLDPVLSGFTRIPTARVMPLQTRWTGPRRLEKAYPVGDSDALAGKTYLTLNWLVGSALEPAEFVAWEVLDRVLLGDDAAPLKRALIDSKLGADIFLAGMNPVAYEMAFHVGLKGSEAARAAEFEALVLKTLEAVAAGPLPAARVEAAFQQLAYQHLEVSTLYPLHVLQWATATWPYGGDPLVFLRMRRHLEACREQWRRTPDCFNTLIREQLLNNSHRLLAVVRPDSGLAERTERASAERLATRKHALSGEAVRQIARQAAELEAAQGVPNSPDALKRLPQLRVGDLPERPRTIPTEASTVAGIALLRNDVFANGVNYFEFDIDLEGMPDSLFDALPRYADAFAKMGAAGQDFTAMAERRAACTGGLSAHARVFRHAADATRGLRRMRFSMKTLDAQAGKALDVFEDLVFGLDPRDLARLRDVLTQSRAWYRTQLIDDGLSTARRRAQRGLTKEGRFDYRLFCPEALARLEDQVARFDERKDAVVGDVEAIRDALLNRRRWTASFTGSEPVFRAFLLKLEEWSSRLKDEAVAPASAAGDVLCPARREGLAGPMEIAYCVSAIPAPALMHPEAPFLRLGLYLARYDYLLTEVRLKGNAYGAGVTLDDGMGAIHQYSYRDPRIVETLEVFDGLRDHLRRAPWTQTDVDRAIIGSAKEVERPIRPSEATGTALTRAVRGDTDDMRAQRYEALRSATPEKIRAATLGWLDAHAARAAVCVVSSRRKLEEANQRLGDGRLALADILPVGES